MPKTCICVGPTALSKTLGVETSVGGTNGWTVPAGTKCIVGVKVSYSLAGVNDDVLPKIARVRIASEDVTIEPCTVYAAPIGSMKTSGNGDQSECPYYPLNIPVVGGEKVYFYGTAIVTTTTAGSMGVTVIISNEGPSGPQYFYKTAAVVYAVATTADLKTTDPTVYTVNGGSKITGVYGMVWQTIAAAATGCAGKFMLESSDFQMPFGPSWTNERGNSMLSVGETPVSLVKVEDLDIPIANVTNITQAYYNLATIAAGAFITGVQFTK